MRTFKLILLTITFILAINISPTLCDTRYARVINETYLYRTSDLLHTPENIICIMEKSYFCRVIQSYNQETINVTYAGHSGFVKKSDIREVKSTPKVETPKGIKFDTKLKCYMRKYPVINSETPICIIPEGTQGIDFVARAIGDSAMDLYGGFWYLARYNDVEGYIYSGYTTGIDTIMPSSDRVTYLYDNESSDLKPMPITYCIVLLVLILLPMSVILFFLFRPRFKKS